MEIGRNDPCPCGSGRKFKFCCEKRGDFPTVDPGRRTQLDTGKVLRNAVAHMQAGRLDAAESLFQSILQHRPRHADALHLLGGVHFQRGDHEAACRLIRRAIKVKPDVAEFHSNLGNALQLAGKSQQAVAALHKSLTLRPGHAPVHRVLGGIYLGMGQRDAALDQYRKAMATAPDDAGLCVEAGGAFLEASRREEALQYYARAIDLDPGNAEARFGRGAALHWLGRLEDAESAFRDTLNLNPQHAQALCNLGGLLQINDDKEQAEDCFRRALEVQPHLPEALNNLGLLMHDRGQFDEAGECFRKALHANGDYAEAWVNLSNLQRNIGECDQARESYATAIGLCPHRTPWRLQRLGASVPTVLPDGESSARIKETFLAEVKALQKERGLKLDLSEIENSRIEFPYDLHFFAGDLRPCKEAYARAVAAMLPPAPDPLPPGDVPTVGFLVTEQHEYAFGKTVGAVLPRLGDAPFRCVIVCTQKSAATIRKRMDCTNIAFARVPEPLPEMVDAVRNLRLDVLYHWEVGTDASNYILPFLRLAPVQCTSIGVQATTGIAAVDAYLSCAPVEPRDAPGHYTEELLLGDSLLAYEWPLPAAKRSYRPEDFNLPPDQNIYLCAQHLGKMHPEFDAVLGTILRRDPGGIVVITADEHRVWSQRLWKRFEDTLPDVLSRINIIPRHGGEAYTGLLQVARILLDPPHFGGMNTAYDGFSLNKPVITLASDYHRGRYVMGCYHYMGLDDGIAESPDHYAELAVSMANDDTLYRETVKRLEAATPALFQDETVIADYRRLFEELISRGRD